jgi:hypothetical protein
MSITLPAPENRAAALSEPQLLNLLADECRAAGGFRAWAARKGFESEDVCVALLRGERLNPSIAEALGFMREVPGALPLHNQMFLPLDVGRSQ